VARTRNTKGERQTRPAGSSSIGAITSGPSQRMEKVDQGSERKANDSDSSAASARCDSRARQRREGEPGGVKDERDEHVGEKSAGRASRSSHQTCQH